MTEMKTLTIGDTTYEIVDEVAREREGDLSELNTQVQTDLVAAINEVADSSGVVSVNGMTGTVVLTAADVGAATTGALADEATARTAADAQLRTDVAVINTQVGALGNGSPTSVATVAEMTEHDKVYLYTGSETGYTAGNWYFWNGSAWTSGGQYGGAVTDTTLSISGAAADAKAVGDALAEKADADEIGDLSQLTTTAKDNLVSAINEENEAIAGINGRLGGQKIGTEFEWEIGSLNPGIGNVTNSSTRIRSKFIPVTNGARIKLSKPTNRLLVYCYDSNRLYVSDSPWLGYNEYTIDNANVAYVRILIRKDTSNTTIIDSEVEGLASGLTISYSVPIEVYTEFGSVVADTEKLNASFGGTRNIEIESGSMSDGKPTISTAYVRSKNFHAVDVGDVFTVAPTDFGIYYAVIYIYTTDNESGYTKSVSIPATTAGNSWSYTFSEKCYFKFRACNAPSSANIKPEDLYTFNGVFTLSHLYSANELMSKVGTLAIDPSAINSEISGKFNLAIQTDTHMSKYVAYTGEKYNADNFNSLKSVVNSINTLDIDLFANLGDMIRGYQCDPDYESRASADAVMDCYKAINTNAAYVIGNHDDGCLFYSNLVYNDHKSDQQVMYPNEQFNRYTKYGLNNKGTSNYWYSDIGGVRIICLYQRDFDYSVSIPGIEAFKIGTEQLNWLTTTALDTSLPVIILTHAPLVTSLYNSSREGFDAVLTALSTFKSNGGVVIAVLSGHTHNQASATVNGITHIVFKNGYTFFELVSVDLSAGTITCKPIANSALNERSFEFS